MNRIDAMKSLARRPLVFALVAALALPLSANAAKYTYHGDLLDGDAPAEGAYDLRVRAFAHPGATKAMAEAIELPGVKLSAGRFSVELDLPEDADGTTWVEVTVRKAGSNEAFEKLGDPQPLSKANSTCPGAWALDGNTGVPSGSFLGIAEVGSTALVLRASDYPVATFTPRGTPDNQGSAPSVALGSPANTATGVGAVVSGGGATLSGGSLCPDCANHAQGGYSSVGGGLGNLADNFLSTVGGGWENTASNHAATVGGGEGNTASNTHSTVGGGNGNTARGQSSVVGGGGSNDAQYNYATIGGGDNNYAGPLGTVGGGIGNSATGFSSTVGGGSFNCAGGTYSWAGGQNAKVRSPMGTADYVCGSNTGDGNGDEGSFVWADSQGVDFVSTGPNQVAIRASGGLRWGGTGVNSTTSPAFTHQVNTGVSGNTCSGGSGVANSRTAINHPLLNGNPDAVIVMTPNYGPTASGVAPPRNPLAIYYNSGADGNCAVNRWVIYDVTLSPAAMNNGAKFNIWFVLP